MSGVVPKSLRGRLFIACSDNLLFLISTYINGQVIPFASVYLNADESQDVVYRVNQELANNAEQRRVREYFDRAYELARNIKNENNAIIGSDKGASYSRRNDSLGSNISRKGRYYNSPSLYVKTKRTDRGELTKVQFRIFDTSKATLKDKPIKLNGMFRFYLKSAFKGVKGAEGAYPYLKVRST